MRCRKIYRLLLAVLWLLASPSLSWGWGVEGYKIVAQVAQDRLGVNALRAVRGLLGNESMADVAIWADEYRLTHRETGPWHFVNIRINDDGTSASFDPEKDCPDHNCVIEKNSDFEKIVGDKSASHGSRIEALKFLIHFVGDIHPPLHCADRRYGNQRSDKGGNGVKVRFPSIQAPLSLHSVWDTTIIEREILNGERVPEYAKKLESELDTAQGKEEISVWRKAEQPLAWAIESNHLAAQVAYKSISIEPPADHRPVTLSGDYVKEAAPVVKEQLEKAGVRLADILNNLFP